MTKSIQELQIGILGGGQLGKMLLQSAADWGLNIQVIDPDGQAPCKSICPAFSTGQLTDYDAVYNFGKHCDLITIEIENVNTEALRALQQEGVKVYPQPEVIEVIKNKRTQKQFYKKHGIPTADFMLVENALEVSEQADFLPAVHKLGVAGYDGRGVQVLKTAADLPKAFDQPGLLEKFIDFEKEISVIVARNESGIVKAFPAVELVFHPEANVVEYLFSPADIEEVTELAAQKTAVDVIEKLGMVGLLAVEMFITKAGEILVNEVAPRPHNSGHQTIEANITSQYEQHLRAILNLPPGNTDNVMPSAMVNLLGEDGHEGMVHYEGLGYVMSIKGAHVHLYGKQHTKPFRKMGHVTLTGEDKELLKKVARRVKTTLKAVTR